MGDATVEVGRIISLMWHLHSMTVQTRHDDEGWGPSKETPASEIHYDNSQIPDELANVARAAAQHAGCWVHHPSGRKRDTCACHL